MKKTRYDEDGFPILDEPLLSPKRLWFASCIWIYFLLFEEDDTWGYWKVLRWYRRPYAMYLKGLNR